MPWSQGLSALVALIAVGLYLVISLRAGMARLRQRARAAGGGGNPEFERRTRIQQNTLEALPAFLVGLYFFSHYLDALAGAIVGLVWILARVLYMRTNQGDFASRRRASLLTYASQAVLVFGGIVGVLIAVAHGLHLSLVQP